MYFWPPIVNFQPVIDAASVAYGLRPNLLGMPPFGANTMAPTRIYNPAEDDVMEVEVFEPNQQKTQRGTAMQPEPNPGPVYANPWSYPYLYGGFGYGPYGGYYGAPYWPTATPWGAYAWPYGGGYPYVYPSYPYWGGYGWGGWGGGPPRRHHKRLPIRGGGRRPNPPPPPGKWDWFDRCADSCEDAGLYGCATRCGAIADDLYGPAWPGQPSKPSSHPGTVSQPHSTPAPGPGEVPLCLNGYERWVNGQWVPVGDVLEGPAGMRVVPSSMGCPAGMRMLPDVFRCVGNNVQYRVCVPWDVTGRYPTQPQPHQVPPRHPGVRPLLTGVPSRPSTPPSSGVPMPSRPAQTAALSATPSRTGNPEENPLAFWGTPYYWAGYGGYPYWGGYPSWGAYPAWGGYPYWGAYPYWGGYSPWWGGGFWGGGFKGKFGSGATISGGGGFGPGVTVSGGGGGSGVTISNPYKHPNIRSLLAA